MHQLLVEAWRLRGLGKYAEATKLVDYVHEHCPGQNVNLLGRIFHIYMQMAYDHGKPEEALAFNQQSIDYYQKGKLPDQIAHALRHRADILSHLKRFDEAEQYYHEAIEIYRKQTNTHPGQLANALRGYALLSEQIQQLKRAVTTWKEIKSLYEACQVPEGVLEANHKINQLQA